MQIQVHMDRHTVHSAELTRQVEIAVKIALGRFGDRVTRVIVYLSDENSSHKFGENDKRCVMEARLAGRQPIVVSQQGTLLAQAIDGAAVKLKKTLQRDLRRLDSLAKRRTRERAELRAADPLLKLDVEAGKREEFCKTLRPLLVGLGNQVWRELRITEANESLSPEQVTLGDLLDKVVTRAWCEFADRPRWMSLDLWLKKLTDKVFEEWTGAESPVPAALHDRAGEIQPQNAPQLDDDQEWSVCLFNEDLSPKMAVGIPSSQSHSDETGLEAEQVLERMRALLCELPKAQRRAYVMSVLEAFTPAEIAMLQDRPELKVRSDIKSARDWLRAQLCADATSQTNSGVLAGSAAGDP